MPEGNHTTPFVTTSHPADESKQTNGAVCPAIEPYDKDPFADAPNPSCQSAEEYLCALAAWIFELLNTFNLSVVRPVLYKHCDSKFKVSSGWPETYLVANDLVQHIENFKGFMVLNPKYHVEVQNTAAQVDERLGRAVVFLTTKVSGIFGSENVIRESANVTYWRREKNGCWVSTKMETLRGPGSMVF